MGIGPLVPLGSATLRGEEVASEIPCEAPGNLPHCCRKIPPVCLKAIRPKMCTAFGVYQLRVHLNLVAYPSQATFENIMDPKLAADLLRTYRFAFVGECCTAGNHKTLGSPREIGGQILGDPVGEILMFRVIGEVHERQNDNGKPCRRRDALADLSYARDWLDRCRDRRQQCHRSRTH